VELEKYWLAHARLSPLQRWLGALQHEVLAKVPGRIVVFIDEIDAVRSLPFSTDEFFAALRQCYNRRSEDRPRTRAPPPLTLAGGSSSPTLLPLKLSHWRRGWAAAPQPTGHCSSGCCIGPAAIPI
jgi:hypothetical protein